MLAVRLDHPGAIGTVELPEPRAPGAGEALVAVRRVGICGTDHHAFAGVQNFVQYPLILGHEVAVDVLAVGSGVTEVREGDQCAVLPYVSCGRCAPCRRGRSNCCERIEVLGVTADGGLRERMVLPARLLYHRTGLSLDQLALVETLGIGWHAAQRGTPDPADTVLVLGAGPIGLAVAECLHGRVTDLVVGDIHPARLAFAAGQGFAAVPVDEELTERLRTRGEGDLPTLVFDATGSKASMERAFGLVGAGGTLVMVGHTTGALTFANPVFHAKELDVRGARNALPGDWTGVLDAVCAGAVDAVSWINHRSTLSTIGDDLPDLAAKPDLVLKAIVDIGGDT